MVRKDHEEPFLRIFFNKLIVQNFYKFIQFRVELKEGFVIRIVLIL